MRLLTAIVLSGSFCHLISAEAPSVPSIRASGEAIVNAQPDQVRIHVGVVTQAPTAQAAAEQNARQLTQALTELRAAAGPGADVKTLNYSVNPAYRYPRDGGTPTITGYTATNVVEVRLRDLSAAGKVIDAATRSGANTVQSVQYVLENEQVARAQALREATLQARANAQAMAAALGSKAGRVLLLAQAEAAPIRPMMQAMRAGMVAAESAPQTPMSPGTVEVQASVTLTVELVP